MPHCRSKLMYIEYFFSFFIDSFSIQIACMQILVYLVNQTSLQLTLTHVYIYIQTLLWKRLLKNSLNFFSSCIFQTQIIYIKIFIDSWAYSKLNTTHKYQLKYMYILLSCKYMLSTNKYFGLDSFKHHMHHIKLDKFHQLKQVFLFFLNLFKR